MDSGMSAADIMALTKSNEGFLEGNGIIILILFFLIFGFGGNGFGSGNNSGGANAYVTTAQFESANQYQTLDRKLNDIGDGLCNLGYTQANLINNGVSNINSNISNEGRALQTQLADCCCSTQRAIDSVKYENAQNTCAITTAAAANTQKILDAICGNRIADMQNQINQLQLQASLCNVVKYPSASYCVPAPGSCGTTF